MFGQTRAIITGSKMVYMATWGREAQQEFSDLARTPMWLLGLELNNQALDLSRRAA
jgi:hypothetical protein